MAPYTSLIFDVLNGNRSLFTSSAGLEAGVHRLRSAARATRRPEVELYDDDSWGPAAANALAGDVGWILHCPWKERGAPDVAGSGLEAIPEAGFGEEVPRLAGVELELAAQLGQVDPQVVGLAAVAAAPHLLQQVGLAYQGSRGPRQHLDQVPLGGRQMHLFVPEEDLRICDTPRPPTPCLLRVDRGQPPIPPLLDFVETGLGLWLRRVSIVILWFLGAIGLLIPLTSRDLAPTCRAALVVGAKGVELSSSKTAPPPQ